VYVIICGGREYILTPEDYAWLDERISALAITVALVGSQSEADHRARVWMERRGVATATFWPNFEYHGKPGGPMRNARMLFWVVTMAQATGDQAGVLALPGGRGTADMVRQAETYGVQVWRRAAGG